MYKIFITGGAGFLGTAFIKTLGKSHKYIVYSRDESKHLKLKEDLENSNIRVNTIIGDVRDYNRLISSMYKEKPDYIVAAHAIKQIGTCEKNHIECIKTNINGLSNIIECVREINQNENSSIRVQHVCFVSTDKAVNPCSMYGTSKKIGEQIIKGENYSNDKYKNPLTTFGAVRYGNVINSTGSVIEIFKKRCEAGLPISYVENTTRFLLDVQQAVYLIANTLFDNIEGIVVPLSIKSAYIKDIALYYANKYHIPADFIIEKKLNYFEKEHEVLIDQQEQAEITSLQNVGICAVIHHKNKNHYNKTLVSNDVNVLMTTEETHEFLRGKGL